MVAVTLSKTCSKCKNPKSFTEFHKNRHSPDGLGHYCKPCKRIDLKERYAKNPKRAIAASRAWRKANRDRHDDYALTRTHGITRAEYDAMFERQNGVCAICGRPESRRNKNRVFRLHVDHDHKTEKIRALLCHHCNAGIGHFRDQPELLEAAAAYLREHGGS